jgi:hypothetical protein
VGAEAVGMFTDRGAEGGTAGENEGEGSTCWAAARDGVGEEGGLVLVSTGGVWEGDEGEGCWVGSSAGAGSAICTAVSRTQRRKEVRWVCHQDSPTWPLTNEGRLDFSFYGAKERKCGPCMGCGSPTFSM